MAKRKTRKGTVRSRAYAAGRRYVAGSKGTAIEAVAGAASFYGLRFLTSNVEQVNKWWWAPPAAMVVGAHILKKKSKYAQAGSAMAGAAGAIGAFAYETSKAAQAQGGTEGFDTGVLLGQGAQLMSNTALDAFERMQPQALPEPAVTVEEDEEEATVGEAAGIGL
jgi:hypothetical protein